MIQKPERYLIISFHDLSPRSQESCQTLLSRLHDIGIQKTSLLVVPNFHHQEEIETNPNFLNWVKSLHENGHEIVLHGYYHKVNQVHGGIYSQCVGRFYTNQEGEFYQQTYDEAHSLLVKGRDILQNSSIPSEGFIAPAWLLSAEARQAVIDLGFNYTTTIQHVETFNPMKRVYAPTLVYSSRSAWRRHVSLQWIRLWSLLNSQCKYLRVAIHPIDLEHPLITHSIIHTVNLLTKTRIPIRYRDMIPA